MRKAEGANQKERLEKTSFGLAHVSGCGGHSDTCGLVAGRWYGTRHEGHAGWPKNEIRHS